jgi:hypothetical protein
MMGLKEEGIHFVTNYQYQLTVFGIELFLSQHFDSFRSQYWRKPHSRPSQPPNDANPL